MSLKLNGATSGYVEIDAPAVAGSTSITLPATSGGEFVVTDSSGNVGIGTTSPGTRLHVETTAQVALRVRTTGSTSSNPSIQILDPTGAKDGLFTYTSGEIAVGSYSAHPLSFIVQNTERARIDTSGRLLVGTSTGRNTWYGSTNYTPQIQNEGNGIATSMISNTVNSNSSSGPYLTFGKTRGTTDGSNTAVQNGDTLGNIDFQGADGTYLQHAARIRCQVDGTPGSADMPGRLGFYTTADGASSPTERMMIESVGNTRISNAGYLYPNTDNATNLGGGTNRWIAVYAANGAIITSDKREKTQIVNSSLGSDFIKSLRPVSYKWIEGGKRDTGERDEDGNYIYESVPGQRTHWGFIAQEVKEAVDAAGIDFGGWVLIDKDDPDSQQALRYDQFIAPLTKALQEALAKIETLEQRLTDAGIA